VSDANAGARDTLTITETPALGTLCGGGVTAVQGQTGVYTITGSPSAINADLANLSFTPIDGVPNTSVTTNFSLSATSSGDPGVASNTLTASVIDSDPAVAPTISGTVGSQIVGGQGRSNPSPA
jgi:hypothetical protein